MSPYRDDFRRSRRAARKEYRRHNRADNRNQPQLPIQESRLWFRLETIDVMWFDVLCWMLISIVSLIVTYWFMLIISRQ